MCTDEEMERMFCVRFVLCFADPHFVQYMGAFYANVVSNGLVENGMCCVDSAEVLANIEKQKQEEEKERTNRSVAVDGLLAMQNTGTKPKPKCT